ncbi:MAG: ABC transporter substrate-binding protein [Chthonomonadales bacterium]|nr:ABC transporter substrate-binding protein [Chthonomonadales bacterium]
MTRSCIATRLKLAATVLAAFAVMGGCTRGERRQQPSDRSADSLAEVSLLLNWFPEAEHGGFFAADVHGFYAEEGLKVTILPGGPGASVAPRVATGAVDFGVENGDVLLLARAQDAPIVALMAPIQTHPRCIMVHEESGIRNLGDLRNVTLAMNAGGAFSHYLKKHVPLTGVTIVPYPGNVARFVTDKRYAQQGYVFSEPFLARQQGAKPRSLLLSDIGFNPYTSCLITSQKTIDTRRDIVERMVRATVKGWEQYLKDPAKTHARITQLNPEMGKEALEYGWEALKNLIMTEDARRDGIGSMRAERWSELLDQLVEIGLIPAGKVKPAEAYSTEYLPRS